MENNKMKKVVYRIVATAIIIGLLSSIFKEIEVVMTGAVIIVTIILMIICFFLYIYSYIVDIYEILKKIFN